MTDYDPELAAAVVWLREHTGPEGQQHVTKLMDTLAIRGAEVNQLRIEKADALERLARLERWALETLQAPR